MFFLELSCSFDDPTDVGNLISGSSAFSKSSLNIWKFSVHVLLKPSLKDFEHYLARMWNELKCAIVWTFLALPFLRTGMKTDLFQSCGHCWVFHICWHFECISLIASSFRILNSSAGIPSSPLTLLAAVLPKAHLTSHSRMSGCEWETTPSHHGYPGHWDLFCTVLQCILSISSWSLLLLLGHYQFCPLLCPSLDEMFLWHF